ncbi:hypothetical protein BH11PLA2_BH11PLA2_21900 [soil metagenome]
MKIRNRHLIRFAGQSGGLFAQGLVRTLRYEDYFSSINIDPRCLPDACSDRLIYLFWHENILLPIVKFGHPSVSVLISKHADGQLLGRLIESVGMGMVTGSTNRGGVEAVRKLIDPKSSNRHLSITPDGPRGPRRIVQPGVVYIASRTGMKIACVGIGYHNPWRARSWDRFAIPKPCSRVKLVASEPIAIASGLKSHELEQQRLRIQNEMDRVNKVAENWAETNKLMAGREVLAAPLRYPAAA